MTAQFKLPAQPMGPSERAEEHEVPDRTKAIGAAVYASLMLDWTVFIEVLESHGFEVRPIDDEERQEPFDHELEARIADALEPQEDDR
jgi:hypothetical protein